MIPFHCNYVCTCMMSQQISAIWRHFIHHLCPARVYSTTVHTPITYPITTSGTIHSNMNKYPNTSHSLEAILNVIHKHRDATLVDTSLEECQRRDHVIRTFFTECFWREEQYPSFKLARSWFIPSILDDQPSDQDVPPANRSVYTLHCLSELRPYQEAYPYVFDYDWELLPPLYKGELLFSDGDNHFLAVEVRNMIAKFVVHGNRDNARVRLAKKRRKLAHSMNIWHLSQPQVKCTEGLLITNEGFAIAEPLVRE